MNNPYKIICKFKPQSDEIQDVYDELFRIALEYKYRKLPARSVVPVNVKELTDSIFSLNSHDQLTGFDDITINGQKLKEIFILTIFLRNFERYFPKDKTLFITIPEVEGSIDVGVASVNVQNAISVNDNRLKLREGDASVSFQIKEYLEHNRLEPDDGILTIRGVQKDKLLNMVNNYTESKLVFLRGFYSFSSAELEEFFSEGGDVYLIGIPMHGKVISSSGGKRKTISLGPGKHNYIIVSSHQTFPIESFNPPRFL